MKTLLVPTDFKTAMLACIPGIVNHFAPHNVNVVLVHMMKITDNVQELMMLSKRSAEHRYITKEFYNACAVLKQAQTNLSNITIEFFYGSTLAVFRSFLQAKGVDSIVLLQDYEYVLLNRNSIEPTVMVNRSGVNIIYANTKGKVLTNATEDIVTAVV